MREPEAPLCLAPRPLDRAPAFSLPTDTCDCHFHAFAPRAPLATPRSYTPRIVTIAGWLALADALGIARGVVVQPSVYGFDNRVLLAALKAHPDRLRGVVVIDPATPDRALGRLDAAGVRGVRVNLRNKGGLRLDAVEGLARRVSPLGWHLQFQVAPGHIPDVGGLAGRLGLPVVVDHAGLVPTGDCEEAAPHVSALQRLLDTGLAFVKLSAPYRATRMPGYPGYAALVAALVESHPERLIWGSDWPHTELFDTMPDDIDLVARMLSWLGEARVRERVFASNPRTLFWAVR